MSAVSPKPSRISIRALLAWGLILGVAVVAGMYATRSPEMIPGGGQGYPRIPSPPDLRTLLFMLGVGSPVWYAVFLSLPFLLWSARRADLASRSPQRIVLTGAIALTALAGLTSWIQFTVTYAGAPSRPGFIQYIPVALLSNLLPWIALAGVVIAVESRRRAVTLAVERERLRTRLAEQRLVALTSQLQPHFLFNTLQGISTLIHRDPNAADQMLGKLAELLRDVLRDRDRALIPLADEIRYARTFLEISKLRFGDRLSYEISIPKDLEGIAVPLFLLQPLVENALAHGIGSRIRGGRIEVRALRDDGCVTLEVADDGGTLPHGGAREGVGLSNTRERLRASFGDAADFSIISTAGGTLARIVLPADTSR